MTRVAVFGGSFNPLHHAHVWAVAWALNSGAVDEVWVIPVFQHYFSKELAHYAHRFEMARLGMSIFKERVVVSDIEKRLGGTSRSLDTLQALKEEHPEWAMRLLIGSDILKETSQWHRFDEVEKLAPPLVLGREGYGGETVWELPNLSSTEIRARARSKEDLSLWVPALVADYISKHSLY